MYNTFYYKQICKEMEKLGKIKNTILLGQQCGGKMDFYGTLKNVPQNKRLEMPVAEEMQLGMSLGLALEGYLPISIYQRMDFLPRACDQLVNHLDLISRLSEGKFNPKVIIRTTIGSNKPLDVGLQHNKNLVEGFRFLLRTIPVLNPQTASEIHNAYSWAIKSRLSVIIVENQDLYKEK